MKKVILLVAFAITVFNGYAQVLKKDVLKGYSEGDILEKGQYTDKTDPIKKDTWCAAFTTKGLEESSSPTVGKPLNYVGYSEGGQSINFGMSEGSKGYRNSVYSMTDSGKEFAQGVYYMSFLINVSKIGTKELTEFLSLNAAYNGTSNRGSICFGRGEGESKKMKFAIGIGKARTEVPAEFDYRKTHLVVVKVDYSKNQISLFINPNINGAEPAADITVTEGVALKAGLKAFTFRNRSGHKGNIGSFRLTSSWSAIGE